MTRIVFFLNRLSIFNSRFVFSVIFFSLGNTILISLFAPVAAIAQNSNSNKTNTLPPPPPLSSPNRIIKTKNNLAVPNNIEPPRSLVQNSQEEYIFTAPRQLENSYKVEVFGKSNFILKQVREVEPKAFIKGNIIQVGIFSQEDNAIDLVRKLALQGLWSRIIVQ